jgi:hypothetical protein
MMRLRLVLQHIGALSNHQPDFDDRGEIVLTRMPRRGETPLSLPRSTRDARKGLLQSAVVAQHQADCAEQCIIFRVLADDYPRAQGGRDIAGLDERVTFI